MYCSKAVYNPSKVQTIVLKIMCLKYKIFTIWVKPDTIIFTKNIRHGFSLSVCTLQITTNVIVTKWENINVKKVFISLMNAKQD